MTTDTPSSRDEEIPTPKLVEVEYIESGTFVGGEEDVYNAKIERGETCIVIPKETWESFQGDFAKQQADLIRISAERETDKHKASEITARAVRRYLDECSASEKWPDEDKVDQLFADNFAPIIHHKLSRAESTLAERDKELAEANAKVAKCIHELGEPDYTVIEKLTAQLLAAQTVNGKLREALEKIVELTESTLADSENKEDRKALRKARAALALSPDPTLLDEVVKGVKYLRKQFHDWDAGSYIHVAANLRDEWYKVADDLLSRLRQSTRETEEKA